MNSKIETALYIGGAVLGVGVIVAIIVGIANYTPPEPERETITVTSKEKQENGMYCYGYEDFKICKPRFKYFINGKKTEEKVFSSVEEGKTYTCEKSVFGWWNKCEEKHETKE